MKFCKSCFFLIPKGKSDLEDEHFLFPRCHAYSAWWLHYPMDIFMPLMFLQSCFCEYFIKLIIPFSFTARQMKFFFQFQKAKVKSCKIRYRMCAIISRSLYIFTSFHCSFYCRVVSIKDNLCPNKEILQFLGLKSGLGCK